ncbi:hypothetical protein [Streptomyces albidoflavus]|nr:hypothetical protein OH810_00180 [Streptomyces albidoflavus]WTD45536.1 hypothetical protein OH730_30400 [Streptomyces albidoflavus]WTD80190.1 hypothetical protein OHA92_00180 [Streptomyces albidoflavus]
MANPAATRWHAADAETRCDKIAAKPGCATYFPTRVMNFDETPVTRGP